MSVVNPNKALGQFADRSGSFTIRCNKASGITITAGLIAKADTSMAPDSWVKKPIRLRDITNGT